MPSVNPGHFAGRAIPDVAADADPATGYLTMSGGKMQIVGGTSASAPLWASLIAGSMRRSAPARATSTPCCTQNLGRAEC